MSLAVTTAAVLAVCACVLAGLASSPLATAAPRASTAANRPASTGLSATESVGEISPGVLWAVVGSGEILSEDGGAHWRNISSDGVPDYFDDLTGVGRDDLWFAVDAIYGGYVNLAVGEGSGRSVALGHSSNAGKTWSVVSLPDSELSSVTLSFVSPRVGFALGGASHSGFDTGGPPNALYKTTDGGRSWDEVSFAPVEGPVDFTAPLDGWALPEGLPGSWASIEETSDGGTTWHAVRPAGAARAVYLAPASFFGRLDGAVPAELTSANGRARSLVVYTTSDGGVTWSAHPVPGAVLSSLPAAQAARSGKAPAVAFVNASTWVMTTGSQLIATADGGLHWSTAEVASWKGIPPESVAFISARTGVANVDNTLVRTTDGGRLWEAVPESAVLPGGARTVNQWPATSLHTGWEGTWSSLASLALPRGAEVTSLSCAADLACSAVDSKGDVASFERAQWSPRQRIDTVGLEDVSCAQAHCLALDRHGRVLVERAGTWSAPRTVLPGGATAASCAGGVCAVVGPGGARTYGPRGWGPLFRAKVGLKLVSCASANFCLALGAGPGEVYDGAGWSPTPPSQPAGATPLAFRALSCASAELCVVVESSGAVGYFLGNGWVVGPMGVSWPSAPAFAPVAVSCSSAALCVAPNADEVASVLASAGWDEPVRLNAVPIPLRAGCAGTNCLLVAGNGATFDFALAAEAGVASTTSVAKHRSPVMFALPDRSWAVTGLQFRQGRVIAFGTAVRGNSCFSAVLDQATGRLGHLRVLPCLGPTFAGSPVAAINVPRTNSVAIRAWWPARNGGIRYGPIIMTLSYWGWTHSGGAVAFGGSIWVYDDESRPMSIVRASAKTGIVEQRVPLPGLSYDPLLRADADGLWVAPGPDFSSYSSGAPLYLVRPGSHAVVVAHRGGKAYEWMVASRHTVFADILSPGLTQTLWRFDGPGARPEFSVPGHLLPGPFGIGTGYAAVGNAGVGLVTLRFVGSSTYSGNTCPDSQQLVYIDPASGDQSVVLTFPAGLKGPEYGCVGDWLSDDQAVISGSEVWLLDGGANGMGYDRLYRIPLPLGVSTSGATRRAVGRWAGRAGTDKRDIEPFMGRVGLLSTTEGWGANGGELYLTTDAGADWTMITPENLLGADPVARIDQFVAVGPSHFWVVISDVPGSSCQSGSCRFGAVDYTTDAGRSWAVAHLPGCFDCEAATSFVDLQHGFVLGQLGSTAVVFETADGGRSWARLGDVGAPAGTTWSGLVFTSKVKGWLVGDDPGASVSLLYSTSDGGRTWARTGLPQAGAGAHVVRTGSPQFFGPDAVLPEVREDTAKRQDRAQIDLTTNGGVTWSKLIAPPTVAPSELDIDGNLTFSAASPTSWYLLAGTRLYATDDAGHSWSYITPTAAWAGGPFQLASVDFVSPSLGWSEVLFNSCGGLPRETEPGSCENEVGLAATSTAGRAWRIVSSA